MTATLSEPSPALRPDMLQVRGLDKSFRTEHGTVPAIRGLDLTVAEGSFLSILGPSGCGKSTFLHIVGGFETASGGEILLDGRAVAGPGPDRGMMFQDLSLYPWLTVSENIAWPLEIKRLPAAARRERVCEILALVGLERFADSFPAELSGGMRQRVAFGRLLALDPRILLMDEPFGALDAQTRELVQEEMQEIWRRDRKTALMVTHDIDEAIFLGTRIVVFTAGPGRIKADIAVPADVHRSSDFRLSPEYARLRAELWELVREEVMEARRRAGDLR